MPKATKAAFYAVHKGYTPAVYTSWLDCEQQIKGYPKAAYKKFCTEAEAKAFVEFGFSAGPVAVAAATGGTSGSMEQPLSDVPVDQTAHLKMKLGMETDIKDERGWDVAYTDGACQGNGQEGAIAGIGVWWGVNDPRNLAERCPGAQTNNRAELIAIIRALETAPQGNKPLLIKTDSSYSISCVRDWIPNWRRHGWKTARGKDVKNKALIKYLADLLDKRGQKEQRVQLQHVFGHIGITGNEGADVLAGIGASMPGRPDRDWSLVEEDAGRNVVVDFEIDENDLLSPEELDRMEAEGEFD